MIGISCKKKEDFNEITIGSPRNGLAELTFLDAPVIENWFVNYLYSGDAKRGEDICINLKNIDCMDSRAYATLLRLSTLSNQAGFGNPYLKGVPDSLERLMSLEPEDYRKFEFI